PWPEALAPKDVHVLLGGIVSVQQPAAEVRFAAGQIVGAPVQGPGRAADLIGVRRQGLDRLACATPHYLLGTLFDNSPGYNSFQWWQESGALTPPPSGALRDLFICEFSTYLATVFGSTAAHTDAQPLPELGFDLRGWEAGLGNAPFIQPSGLNVRHQRPGSRPVLREVVHAGRSIVALVNESDLSGIDVDEGVLRPSLWIDFDYPQRAVGLEYGYLPDAATEGSIWGAGVMLMAYDEQGRFVVGADGDGCGLTAAGEKVDPNCISATISRNVNANRLDNLIGVRDSGGRIASVELRFGFARAGAVEGPGRRIVEPQVVSRIWRESLPPAAVLQGLVGVEGARTGPQALAPFAQRYGVPAGPRTFELPYRFDRAVAFLRGFRLEASDAPPRTLKRLSIGLQQNDMVFHAGQGDTLTLTPFGSVRQTEGGGLPFDIVAYYTVVAWDSRQVDLGYALGESRIELHERLNQLWNSTYPSIHTHGLSLPAQGERLFAGLQSVSIELMDEDEIDELVLWPGYQRGVRWAFDDAPMLRELSGATVWRMQSRVETDEDRLHWNNVRMVLLAGHSGSLSLGADLPADPLDDVTTVRASQSWSSHVFTNNVIGPRLPPRAVTFDPAAIRDRRLAWPLRATVPFLTLGLTMVKVGTLGELDVEARGEFYDGRLVDWSLSYGWSHDPLTSETHGRRRGMLAFPVFGAVNPAMPRAGGRPSTAPLVMSDAVIGCENPPEYPGLVQNTDRVPLRIVAVQPYYNPHLLDDDGNVIERPTPPRMFDYEFLWRGQRFDVAGLLARLPLHLRAGEHLQIHPTYTPAGPAGVPGTALPTHGGYILFETEHSPYPNFVWSVSGRTDGIRPAARWSVPRVQLGEIAPGTTRRQTVQLESTGDARLCVTRAYFNESPSGFAVFSHSNALDPAVFTIELGCTHAQPQDCQGRTDLIIESNAGTLTLPVTANVDEPPLEVPPCVTPEDYFRGCREEG
ncbi:MAG: hypothetical protein KIS79_10830, partial [Burkholderiales bacterium]|nr:hypothetical protein [Burkholderiales bacterium]